MRLILDRCWDLVLHEAHFYHHWVLLLHEAHLHTCRDLFLHEAHFYHHWVLLHHEAHLNEPWVLFLCEAHLDDSLNFSNFPPKNGKNFAPVCNVE